jgi:NAD(P)-dependent dehydrogenase (short-subunit alcohol dehydrogenase family)
MTSKKTWFITGAGRGMGVEFAKAALAAGQNVVATGRNPDAVREALGSEDELLSVKLDVTSTHDAEAAVQAAVDRFGRIDVLVNNAASFYAGYFAPEVEPFAIHTTIVNPGFRTELLTKESTNYATPSIEDYAERNAAKREFWESQNGQQSGDPAKLAQALLTIADEEQPPRRFIAGADGIDTAEQQIATLNSRSTPTASCRRHWRSTRSRSGAKCGAAVADSGTRATSSAHTPTPRTEAHCHEAHFARRT